LLRGVEKDLIMERSLEETFNRGETKGTTGIGRRAVLRSIGVAGVGLATGVAVVGASGHGEPTEIDACTTITEPGEYVLVDDLHLNAGEREACIVIESDDVTLRGDGHTLTGGETVDGGFGVAVNPDARGWPPVENVTVEDLTVTGFRQGIHYRFVDGGSVRGVRAVDNSVGIALVDDVLGVSVEHSRITDCWTGLWLVGDSEIGFHPGQIPVRHNDVLRNDTGIRLGAWVSGNPIERNRIIRNEVGIVQELFAWENGVRYNHICDNEVYGYLNSDGYWVDLLGEIDADPEDRIDQGATALENYWGATNGPSSFGDPEEPLTDPETGRPADGDGDAISESLDGGISNVRFDPFLESPLEDVGADLE
jgi:hypothetical protein